MNMLRSVVVLIAAVSALIEPAFPCSCGPTAGGPACSLVGSSDVIFTGRVAYSNDNGSGQFAQGTLVRFAVEEVFKGLPAGTRSGEHTSELQSLRHLVCRL